MIDHITYKDAGGISTYIDNLISGNPGYQTKLELNRDFELDQLRSYLSRKEAKDTLVFHDPYIYDPYICGPSLNLGTSKILLALHSDHSFYYNASEKLGLWADGFLCVSSVIRANLNRRFRQKSMVLGPCIDIPKNSLQELTTNRSTNLIFVGREDANKGVHLLPVIDAHLMKYGVRAEWSIVLGSRPEVHREFRDWVSGTQDRVSIHESIPNEDLRQMLLSQSCLILPSQNEGHPMVIIEALAHGVAPFSFHYHPDCHSHLPEDYAGIVTPSEMPEELALKVTRHIERDHVELNQWMQTAVDFVSHHHNPERQFHKLKAFTRSIKPSKKSSLKLKRQKWQRKMLRFIGK